MSITKNIIKQNYDKFCAEKGRRYAQMQSAGKDNRPRLQMLVDFYGDLIAVCWEYLKRFD